jgi:hypothetical protein
LTVGSERLILSWEPSQLILTRDYELGFQDDSKEGVQASFIALGVQHEPLDQTDLKDGVDAILGGDGESFWKRTTRWGHRGPSGVPKGRVACYSCL